MKRLGLLGLVVVVALAAQGRAQAQTAAAVDDVATAPVEIDGIVLFRVRGVTSYSAPLRARAIRDRIIAAADDPIIPAEDLGRLARPASLSITLTPHGGHCGYYDSQHGSSWLERQVLATLAAR